MSAVPGPLAKHQYGISVMGDVVLHPSYIAAVAERAVHYVRRNLGNECAPADVASALAIACGQTMGVCVENGADQAAIDQITAHLMKSFSEHTNPSNTQGEK